jgi:hypothetical protein
MLPQEETKWARQIKSLFISPHAILKLTIVSILWFAAGVALGLYYNIGFLALSIFVFLFFMWFFPFLQPIFSIVYFIVGNKNISPRLESVRLTRVYTISLGVRVVFLVYLVYVGIKLLLK